MDSIATDFKMVTPRTTGAWKFEKDHPRTEATRCLGMCRKTEEIGVFLLVPP